MESNLSDMLNFVSQTPEDGVLYPDNLWTSLVAPKDQELDAARPFLPRELRLRCRSILISSYPKPIVDYCIAVLQLNPKDGYPFEWIRRMLDLGRELGIPCDIRLLMRLYLATETCLTPGRLMRLITTSRFSAKDANIRCKVDDSARAVDLLRLSAVRETWFEIVDRLLENALHHQARHILTPSIDVSMAIANDELLFQIVTPTKSVGNPGIGLGLKLAAGRISSLNGRLTFDIKRNAIVTAVTIPGVLRSS